MTTDDGAASGPAPRAVVSYLPTQEDLARRVAAVARDIEGGPGYWRRFVVTHTAVTALFVATPWVLQLTGTGGGTIRGAARATILAVVAMSVLTLFDRRQRKRGLRQSLHARLQADLPPGILVGAVWTPEAVLVRHPTREVRTDLGTVTAARHDGGVLRLDHPGGLITSFPDALVGREGMGIVRAALGARLREPVDAPRDLA